MQHLKIADLKFRRIFLCLVLFSFVFLGITQVKYIKSELNDKKKKILNVGDGIYSSIAKQSFEESKTVKNSTVSNSKITRQNGQQNSLSFYVATNITTVTDARVNNLEKKDKSHENSPSSSESSCEQLRKLTNPSRIISESEARKQNDLGNRGVKFLTVRDDNNQTIKLVVKYASVQKNTTEYRHFYRYTKAVLEVDVIRKLSALKWSGFPKLYGACITPNEVTYAVEQIEGNPFCKGTGLNATCYLAKDIMHYIFTTSNANLNALKFLTNLVCFFHQFERDNIFMEDLIGSNLFYSKENFDIYIADADSLLFYGNVPIHSRMSCTRNHQCRGFTGNFWHIHSINRKIYSECQEFYGNCVDNICSGFTASLHACGIGKWLVARVGTVVPQRSKRTVKKISHCLSAKNPAERCSFKTACQEFSDQLKIYKQFQRTF